MTDIIEVHPPGGQPKPNARGVVEYAIDATYTPAALMNVRNRAAASGPIIKRLAGGKPIRVYRMVILQPSGDTWLAINTATDRHYVAFLIGPKILGRMEFRS